MRCLIAREWRENRALILGFLAVTPVLSLLLKWLLIGWEKTQARDSIEFVIPSMLALIVLAIASDLVSGDSASGRHSFFAALPVRPATRWAAKTVFLFGAAAIYFVYLILFEVAVLGIAGKDGLAVFDGVARYSHFLPAFVILGAATLFWSTLLDRGFTAAFAALVSLAMLAGVVAWFRIGRFHLGYRKEELFLQVAAVVAGAFLMGSFLAFVKGRIHLGAKVRRTVLAVSALLIVLVPAGAQAAIRLERWLDIRPTDPNLQAGLRLVDPTGTWAFVGAGRIGVGPLGARSWGSGPHAFFAVHLRDGRIRDLTDYGGIYHTEKSFWVTGRVKLIRHDVLPDRTDTLPLIVDYDLEAGKPVTTRPWDRREDYAPFRRDPRIPRGWSVTGAPRDWGTGLYVYRGRRQYGILDWKTGKVREMPGWVSLLPPTPEGDAFSMFASRVLRMPLAGGKPEVIATKARTYGTSPDGTEGFAIAKGELLYIDADTGKVTRHRAPEGDFLSASWSADGRHFVAITASRAHLFQKCAEPSLTQFSHLEGAGGVQWFDGERVIVTDERWRTLSIAEKGGTSRRLFPVEVER